MTSVDLWLFDFSNWWSRAEHLGELLTPEEWARTKCFRFEADRVRSLLTRALVRRVLGRVCQTDPRSLRFSADSQGKPYLMGKALHFNISHTRSYLTIALAEAPVGVDVEEARANLDVPSLAKRVLREEELVHLKGLSRDLGRAWFLRLWTEREAFFKGTGRGLRESFNTYEWQALSGRTKAVVNRENRHPTGWFTHYVVDPRGAPREGYRGAQVSIATRCLDTRVVLRSNRTLETPEKARYG